MDNINRFIGSSVVINSKTWGQLHIESASFTPAIDGDLIVQIGKPFASNNPLVRIHSECIFSEISLVSGKTAQVAALRRR